MKKLHVLAFSALLGLTLAGATSVSSQQADASYASDVLKEVSVLKKINKKLDAKNAKKRAKKKVTASDKYGRVKKVAAPANIRGTWYSYDKYAPKKITIHKYSYRGWTFYKRGYNSIYDKKYDVVPYKIQKKTKWWRVENRTMALSKLKVMNLKPYWSGAGAGISFGTRKKTIGGKKRPVLFYIDGNTATGNYYRSKSLARKMKNHHFRDVAY